MFLIPFETIFYHIIPTITALFLFLGLAYLIVIKQYKSTYFSYYVCFLICFTIFLLGRPLQFYSGHILAHLILYIRFLILFSIGFPSLLIANKMRCGLTLNRWGYVLPYIMGGAGAVVFVMVRDGCTYQILFAEEFGYILPLMFTEATYSDMLIITTAILVVLPSLYLVFYHLRHNLQFDTLFILISSFSLGTSYIVGEFVDEYWLFYFCAFLISSIWLRIGYEDIRSSNTQSLKLKQELKDISMTYINDVSGNERFAESDQALAPLLDSELEQTKSLAIGGDSDSLEGKPSKPTVKNRELVDRAISFIKANFNSEIEIAEIANYTGVSDSYLIRTFKKVKGKTINQYVTCYRVQRAQKLLKNHTVVETSRAVGFKNPSYFSTVFKKQIGMSPLHYQQQLYD